MIKNILITGATGLVGKALIASLLKDGYNIAILTRNPEKINDITAFAWDVAKQTIDVNCFKNIDTVVHLAGAGIADERWTAERKQEITNSRTQSTALLYQTIKANKFPIKNFISASAVGYYGNSGAEILTETSTSGTGFLANCCQQWENAVDEGLKLEIRVVKIRIGLILDKNHGALPAIAKPISYFAGAALGSGKQYMPWIHIDDIVGVFTEAIANQACTGAFNACAPQPVTNAVFTRAVAKQLRRPIWPFNIPTFVLNLILGEMSILPLMSNHTIPKKLLDIGFKFKYAKLNNALSAIYK